jgi:response regulator RpfG family c-di-GMP phosphodiesterase
MKDRTREKENYFDRIRSIIIDEKGIDLPVQPNILTVDDENSFIKLVSSILTKDGYKGDSANNLSEAYEALSKKRYDIIFLDLALPDGSGFRVLERALEIFPETLVVMITGIHDLQVAVNAIRKGAYDYITKPFSVDLFRDRLTTVVEEWKSRTFSKSYQNYLEYLVREKTDELTMTVSTIEHVHDTTVLALGAALDLRDPETEEHCRRVSKNSIRLGMILGIEGKRLRNLKWGSYLHDIGKIGIPESILLKSGPLTEEEFSIVKKHSILGQSMIKNIDFLTEASEVVLYHHEKYEGSGYPLGLRGSEIPLFARIFAVVDAFDAMAYNRPYRKALTQNNVIKELNNCSGTHFDPDILEKFVGNLPVEKNKMSK